MTAEIIVDNFAGGGGASLGISWGCGKHPDLAINHDEEAIVMHAANHPAPGTRHITEDVWNVSPKKEVHGNSVGLAWFSPDCKHFSRAKGAKPVEKKIRGLAWVAVKWAEQVKPRVIILENVREFMEWGPLNEKSMPDPKRKGLTFKRFVGRLKNLGYVVDWRILNAADYGAPTHRRRLFLIARCDGQEIVWPEPSHGDPKKIGKGLFTAHQKPWRTAAECIDWTIPCPSIFDRKKPLAEKTMARIAAGMKRFVIDSPDPFIVHLTHHGARRVNPVSEPLPTVTAAHRGEMALISPALIQYNGEQTGKEVRGQDLRRPINVIPTENRFALVSAFLAKHFTGAVGSSMRAPIGTVTTQDHNALVAANLVHLNNGHAWSGADQPMRTVTSAGTHAALVYSFLIKYFGTGIGQTVKEPLHTVTTKDRFGLVIIHVNGEPHVIVDIGMRMLTPRELARAQGFPDDYILTGTNTSQVAKIGNSVSPYPAAALVRVNYGALVEASHG